MLSFPYTYYTFFRSFFQRLSLCEGREGKRVERKTIKIKNLTRYTFFLSQQSKRNDVVTRTIGFVDEGMEMNDKILSISY